MIKLWPVVVGSDPVEPVDVVEVVILVVAVVDALWPVTLWPAVTPLLELVSVAVPGACGAGLHAVSPSSHAHQDTDLER